MKTLIKLGLTTVFTLLLAVPVMAHNGKHRHGKKKKTKVVVVNKPVKCSPYHALRVLPKKHKVITHNKVKYYYYGNQYYVFTKGYYVVVNPPKALFIIR